MVVANRAHCVKSAQVVFVGRVVAMPSDHIEWRVIQFGSVEVAHELRDQLEITFNVFVPRHRGLEIARVGQTVGADYAQVGQPKRCAVALADVTTSGYIKQLDAKANATRDHHDFLRFGVNQAEFGSKAKSPLLQHNQHLTVGAIEETLPHRAIDGVQIDGCATLHMWVAITGHADEAVDEVHGFRGGCQGLRIPTQLIGRRRDLQVVLADSTVADVLERRVRGAGADAIEPGATVGVTRRGEGRARNLLGVQAIGADLRRVLADRQGTW